MMPGMIMLWYGAIVDIPTGWTLCDGTNGTPNLNGLFVRGAGAGPGAPGTTGGSVSHNHDFTGDGHSHDVPSGESICGGVATDVWDHHTTVSPATGTTDSGSSYPPFHTLCYIMKTPVP